MNTFTIRRRSGLVPRKTCLWDFSGTLLSNSCQTTLKHRLRMYIFQFACRPVVYVQAALSRSWVAGRLWNPPPPRLAGCWARPRKKAKMQHFTASSHAWYGGGHGFARVGGGSTTFLEHPYLILQVALPFEPPIKTKNTKYVMPMESPHQTNVQLKMFLLPM